MRIIAASVALSGCALGASGPFSGELEGLDAVVGLVLDNGIGRLYVCGGDNTRDTHTRWFDVALEGGLVGERDGWTVTAEHIAGGFSGTLTDPGGVSWAFAADPPTADIDGLYTADEGACPPGVVVWGGTQMQGVVCLPGGLNAQVVPVGQLELQSDGGIKVQVPDGVPFVVVPVTP